MALGRNPVVPAGPWNAASRLVARMRTTICVIERRTTGRDAGGAPVGGYAAIAKVACKVKAAGRMPVETVAGGRVGPVVDYEIAFPTATDVRSDDRIVVNGRTMEIISDRDAVSHGMQLNVLVKASAS